MLNEIAVQGQKGVTVGLAVLMAVGVLDFAALRYLRKKPPTAHTKPGETLHIVERSEPYASALQPSANAAAQNTTNRLPQSIGNETPFHMEEVPSPPASNVANVNVVWIKSFITDR